MVAFNVFPVPRHHIPPIPFFSFCPVIIISRPWDVPDSYCFVNRKYKERTVLPHLTPSPPNLFPYLKIHTFRPTPPKVPYPCKW